MLPPPKVGAGGAGAGAAAAVFTLVLAPLNKLGVVPVTPKAVVPVFEPKAGGAVVFGVLKILVVSWLGVPPKAS